MKILSWNINGIRAAYKNGFLNWFIKCKADIFGVQEIRANFDQIPLSIKKISNFYSNFVSSKKKGYSGVALFSKKQPNLFNNLLGNRLYDDEGRLQVAFFNNLIIANVYFPNGSGKKNDNSRIPYKLDFYAALYKHLSVYEKTNKNILVLGDFNTAHKEIDLACPLSNVNSSGFSLIERLELDRWISCGYVDTFRSFNSYSGQYTWWSNRKNSRNRNIGWRIDYILASKHAIKYIKDAFIFPNVYGSDHCPIGVDVDDRIMD